MEKTHRFLPYFFAVFCLLVIYCFYQSFLVIFLILRMLSAYIVVALLVISILMIINQEQAREMSLPVLAANVFDLPVFLVFYGLATYYRKKTAYHSRFMIMSVLPFINPALARLLVDDVSIQIGLCFS